MLGDVAIAVIKRNEKEIEGKIGRLMSRNESDEVKKIK